MPNLVAHVMTCSPAAPLRTRWAARAPSLGDLASSDWWRQQGEFEPPVAPDWVLQEATRDVFQVGR